MSANASLQLLHEFRAFRSEMRIRLDELTAAVVEVGRTVRSIPGLVDAAQEQGTNLAVLEARLSVVEDEKAGNGGSPR